MGQDNLIKLLLIAGFLFSGLAWAYGIIGASPTLAGPRIIVPEKPLQPPPEKHLQVVVLGTSLTTRGNWVDELQTQLNNCTGLPVNISRLAQAGASSRWGVKALTEYYSNPSNPKINILIVEFSGNDASLYNGFPLILSRKYHQSIIELANSHNALVFLATMSPAWGRNAWERPGQNRYHALYRDLALETGSGLIDTTNDWKTLGTTQREEWLPDGLHPTSLAMSALIVPPFIKAITHYLVTCTPRTPLE